MESKPKSYLNKKSNGLCQSVEDSGMCGPKPRRSMPMKEVDELLERQARRLAKEPTLYDQRLELLAKLDNLEGQRDYHTDATREFNFRILSTKKDLEDLNQAIASELQLDSLR